ncbi:hypothetical protein [Pedobacter sp. UYP24]
MRTVLDRIFGLFYTPDVSSLKGYKNANRMAVYSVDVKTILSIGKIKALKQFKNMKMNQAYLALLKKDLKIGTYKTLTKPTKVFFFCYYYESDKNEPSFISYKSM